MIKGIVTIFPNEIQSTSNIKKHVSQAIPFDLGFHILGVIKCFTKSLHCESFLKDLQLGKCKEFVK